MRLVDRPTGELQFVATQQPAEIKHETFDGPVPGIEATSSRAFPFFFRMEAHFLWLPLLLCLPGVLWVRELRARTALGVLLRGMLLPPFLIAAYFLAWQAKGVVSARQVWLGDPLLGIGGLLITFLAMSKGALAVRCILRHGSG